MFRNFLMWVFRIPKHPNIIAFEMGCRSIKEGIRMGLEEEDDKVKVNFIHASQMFLKKPMR